MGQLPQSEKYDHLLFKNTSTQTQGECQGELTSPFCPSLAEHLGRPLRQRSLGKAQELEDMRRK